MTDWYVARSGKQEGPLTAEEVIGRLRDGQLSGRDHVFKRGFDAWKSIHDEPAFAAVAATAAPVTRPASTSHEIDFHIHGEEMQFVSITLDPGEACIAEAGSFLYMDPEIEVETIFGDGSASSEDGGFVGKLLSAGKRVLTGESLFMTLFGNRGGSRQDVAFASPYPGRIVPLDLKQHGGTILCQKQAFLCAAKGVAVGIALHKKIGAGFFGGEGFILQKLEGDGLAFVHAGGTIIERLLAPGESLRVDTGCLVAFEQSVDYDIQMVSGIKTALFGGDGLFYARLTGPGRIWVQSLPFSRLASRVWAAAPQAGGKNVGEGSVLGGLGDLVMGNRP